MHFEMTLKSEEIICFVTLFVISKTNLLVMQRNDIFPLRPKLFEFSRAFINTNISSSKRFLVTFIKILLTFGYILTILSHFHKMRQLFWSKKQLVAFQFF